MSPKNGQPEVAGSPAADKKPRAKAISQSVIPAYSLEKALLIPQEIVNSFGGHQGEPNQIALAMKWTPTGGAWRMLCGSAVAYGLTEGGYNANAVKLTERGSAIVAPQVENGDKPALREALLEPSLMGEFIKKYDNQKFPPREIGINVIAGMGLPRERCADAFDLIEENLKYVGALQQTKTGYMVMLSMIGQSFVGSNGATSSTNGAGAHVNDDEDEEPASPPMMQPPAMQQPPTPQTPLARANTNVFISHGKNRELVDHLKKVVGYSKLTPVVSVEITDTSKPVPQKVLQEMRSCFGGIVHVRSEGEWTDSDGKTHMKINDNVLIEIGAAMAIYKDNFILLAEKGVTLPSNLQGLFVCNYEGDTMDGEATMRLLEGLSKFKPNT